MKIKLGLCSLGIIFLAGCSINSAGPEAVDTASVVISSTGRSSLEDTPQIASTSTMEAVLETPSATPLESTTRTAGPLDALPIVANGGFEEGTGTPFSWSQEAWILERSVFRWEEDNPACGSKCISITNVEENDARWIQTIRVVPGEIYILSGRIKGENIRGNELGANLFAGDGFNHTESKDSTGTFDWKTVSLTFIGPQSGEVVIGCRLGYFGSTVTGTAYFDDILVTVDDTYRKLEGRNIDLYLEKADLDPSVIRPESLSGWVEKLDRTYDEYAALVGKKPYDGEKIRILSTRAYPGGWAVAGNPILWHQPYVREELSLVEKENDSCFGILHELGHDFDIEDRWNFHAEFFANFKMYYAVVRLQAKVSPAHPVYYEGTQLKDYYQSKIIPGELSWDGITYRFIVMTEQIGWEPFMKTFRFFLDLPESSLPAARLGKYRLFLDKLSEYSGQDVRSWIPQEEQTMIENDLAK
jgi:hypothetical protein